MTGRISEIFQSIQGEGVYQGLPQVFVRFYGCNLNCFYCDTTLDFYKEMALDEISREISLYNNYYSISLTGGEPLLQVNFLEELARFLKEEGKVIYLETNGVLYRELSRVINYVDIIAMDFKLPSSTSQRCFWDEHREFLKIACSKDVFVKAVIGKDTILEDILTSVEIIKAVKKDVFFILQPQNPYEELLEEKLSFFQNICNNSNIYVKITPQIHKKLGIR